MRGEELTEGLFTANLSIHKYLNWARLCCCKNPIGAERIFLFIHSLVMALEGVVDSSFEFSGFILFFLGLVGYSVKAKMRIPLNFYEDLDSEKGLICAAKESFRVFNSLLRWGNSRGIPVMAKMYGPQLNSKSLPESSLLSDCQIYANRSTGESKHLKHKGKILEIGVASGSHAVSLIQALNPSTFHGVDVKVSQVSDESKAIFTNHGNKGNVVGLYQEDSAQFLEDKVKGNQKYDVIYIDANHWYEFVYKELELSSKLVDVGGHIVFNDYLNWFIGSMEPCGVVKAVNDFLVKNENWKVEYFAINDRDICIRRVV